ncbi:hypothetical protein LCGC14_0909760 [marine sediment metagenome]|uniref:Uncharacterized protein n=1 Tax=marine sediment metagenome TaxID=412755 RepID=A0A0F9S0T7_9ZZZZ
MGIGGDFDHELKIGSDTQQFRLIRDENGAVMYNIRNIIPQYRDPLTFTQATWIGGHGSFARRAPDTYFEGQSIDTTQEGRVFLGPLINTVGEIGDSGNLDSAVVQFVWFEAQSKWLCATASKIYLYTTGWTAATTAVAGVTHMAEFKGIMYAAVGTSTLYYYSTDGDTWTQTDLTDGYAERFLVTPNPDGTAENLWKFKQPNELSRTTDGRLAASSGVQWESPTFVGDTSHNITNIFLQANKLMVGREDNLFQVDSNGGVHPFRDDLKINQSTNNYKYVAEWQTSVYHSEARGMAEITSYNSYDVMGPLTRIDDIGKVGDIVGMAGDKDWVYVAVDEGTNTIIYKGREVLNTQGGLQWQWCPWVFLGTNACATIAIAQHSTTDFRLWFGYGTTTAYVIITDNPTSDSAARFTTSGFLRMSYDYGTDANWDKLWQSAVLEVVGGASGETVQIKYRKDTDTSATSIIAAAVTNGIFESNFAAELTSNKIQFEIHLASNTNTATPEVRYFQAKGVEKPTTVRIHEATYAIDDSPSEDAEVLRDLLRTGRTSTTLIRFANLNFEEYTSGTAGTNYVNCVMEPGFPQEVEIVHLDGREPEQAIRVNLREVSFS